MSNSKLSLVHEEKEQDGECYEYTSTVLVKDSGPRGLGLIQFMDGHGQICSLQDSSLATEPAIWIGIDNTGNQMNGPNGNKNEQISARMHLTASMVRQLLPYLTEFAKNDSRVSSMEVPFKEKSKESDD